MIAAVTTTLDEADIIEATATCLLNGGVDLILAADSSTDGTPEILERLGAEVTRIDEPLHRQPHWMNRLAREAHSRGADWIVPWDADEFWFGLDRLDRLTENVAIATLWHHIDFDRKVIPAESLPKVAYRWQPGAVIANGNHDVSIDGPRVSVLEIRHLQYRSFDHFGRKVSERVRTLDPVARKRGDGAHHTRLDGATDDQLRAAWGELEARDSVYDPIPCSR